MSVLEKLMNLQDSEYKNFQCALMPTVDKATVLGVRMPDVRRLAKEINHTPEAEAFLKELPHSTYDENNLHGALIALEKSWDRCVELLEIFLPYVDNWATCDMMSPKILARYPEKTLACARRWIKSPYTYARRFGILTLMRHFAKEHFSPLFLHEVAEAEEGDYYIVMMKAWYYATLLSVGYDETKAFLENSSLSDKVIKKSIQKACESRRITPEEKAELRRIFN